MDFKNSKKLLALLAACYWIFVVVIYLVAGSQFHYTVVTSDTLSANATIGELVDGMTVTQSFVVPAEQTLSLELMTSNYGRANSGVLHVSLENMAGETVAAQDVDVSTLLSGEYTTLQLDEAVVTQRGETLTLKLATTGCQPGNAVTLYYGNTVTAGRFDIVQNIAEADRYAVNGEPGLGKLCMKANGVKILSFYKTYWFIVGGVFALIAACCAYWWKRAKQGRNNPLVAVCTLCTRYAFLIK